MWSNCLFVALGGGLGAVGRYLLSLIAAPWSFPVMTLLTNFLGAVVIGAVAQAAGQLPMSKSAVLFLKTGLCGGFTTFSTFSLETVELLEQGRGASYVAGLWNLRSFQAEKIYTAARRFSLPWCRRAVVRCGEVDLAMKSTGQDGQQLLTGLLLELSAPARKPALPRR